MTSLILFLRSTLITFMALAVVACSSVNNEKVIEEEVYEIEDVVQTNAAVYSCDDKLLNVYFHGDQAELTWKNETHLLNHAVSASGSSFLGESLSFVIQSEKAVLSTKSAKEIQCLLLHVDS
ncbi:MliC family protein [Marinomonas sp. 2405UD66-6]|uniref:MliC family protein n=1 Tax=Marinomonas sp. 2405UD66-6 TaxID=3391834 RepID=UPI0039C999AD